MTSVAVPPGEATPVPDGVLHALTIVAPAETPSSVRLPSPARLAQARPVADLATAVVVVGLVHLLVGPVHVAVSLTILALWMGLLVGARSYAAPHRSTTGSPSVRPVLRAGTVLGLTCWVTATLAPASASSGQLLLLTTAITTGTLVERIGLDALMRRSRETGHPLRLVLLGAPPRVAAVLADLRAALRRDVQVVAACLSDEAPDGLGLAEVPTTVGLHEAAATAATWEADAVLALPDEQFGPREVRRLGWELEGTRTGLLLGTGLRDVSSDRASLARVGGLDLLHVRTAEHRSAARALKAVWERLAAACVLALLAPCLVALAVLVRCDSAGPAIFKQSRVGRNGRTFTMYKFRTMLTAAESLRAELEPASDGNGVLFKLHVDPRVTRVGAVLRRYSLDELPQLVNVLLGQMALVGPRPALPTEVDGYDDDPRRRLAVKPGLTGLWQVSGRSDLSWEESVRLDLLYVDNWSLGLDLSIVARTAGAVLGQRGAY